MAVRKQPPADAKMDAYAARQTATLLRRFAYQLNHASKMGDADSVHDLRTSIRRFTQGLRVFDRFLPRGKAKKVRRQLKEIMELAAQVRDRDIALELLAAAGLPASPSLWTGLQRERKLAEQKLVAAVRRRSRRNYFRKWRTRLNL